MIDWGIPNWLDQCAYGNTKRWSENRWRWEFIRRREDCREDFLAHKDGTVRFYEEVYAKMQYPGRILRPNEPGFVARVPGCYERYRLANLPNPAIGDQPSYIIIFRKRGPLLMDPEDGINGRFKTTEAVVVFDLTAPIGDQVAAGAQAWPYCTSRQEASNQVAYLSPHSGCQREWSIADTDCHRCARLD
jgi:hypothetical protein